MRNLYSSPVVGSPTLQPRAPRPSSRIPVGSSSKPDSETPFMPKLSALLKDMEDRGPMRSAAFRDLRNLAPKFEKERLWDSANLLLKIITDKDDDPFERMEAIKTIVFVLNAIRKKMITEKRKGVIWSAESQIPVQDALPKVNPGSVMHAAAEDVAAEKERFGRMESVREHAMIGSLNSVALVETFDNTDIADSIKLAVARLDSPYAKKLVNRIALENLVDPLDRRPEVRAKEPSEVPQKKRNLEELFDLGIEEGRSEVG